jgi:hypothetical protein
MAKLKSEDQMRREGGRERERERSTDIDLARRI